MLYIQGIKVKLKAYFLQENQYICDTCNKYQAEQPKLPFM